LLQTHCCFAKLIARPAADEQLLRVSDLGFIHRFQPAQTPNARVLLLLHGTGGDENDLLPIGRMLDRDAALLSPRGKVMENGNPRFFRRFAEGVFDEQDVIRRAGELADFINAAAAEYQFTIEQVTAVGYSNGANIAAAVLLVRPEAIRNAILLRAMLPLSEATAPDLHGHHVLISAGEDDPIVPASEGTKLAEVLRSGGANVTLVTQHAGHNLVPEDFRVAQRWLTPHQ
jgi:phospholipase/carboxylesterase